MSELRAQFRTGDERRRSIEQRGRSLGLAAVPGCARRPHEPTPSRLRVGGQLGSPLERGDRRSMPASEAGALRRPLELDRDVIIRANRRRRPMPRPPISVGLAREHCCERAVSTLALTEPRPRYTAERISG